MNLILENLIVDQNVQVILSALLSLVITWQSLPVIRNICEIKGLMESPIKRSSHIKPIATFGGIAILAGTLIGFMLWDFKDPEFVYHRVIAGLLILFFLGLKDDLYPLAPVKKIITQIGASVLVVVGSDLRISSFYGIFGVYELPYVVSLLLTIFLFVALINSFNLIDGIDGLSSGIGMISSGGFGLWFLLNEHWSLACLGLSLAASLLGFLRFNFSKTTKIFMGDTGSLVIGFLVTVMAVKFIEISGYNNFSPGNHFVSAPVLTLALLSVPIFDTLRVFGLRLLKGRSPFHADRLHVHHLLVDNGMSHVAASLTLYAMTIVFSLFTYSLRTFFSSTALSLYVVCMFAIYLALGAWLEVKRFKNHKENLSTGKLGNGRTKVPLKDSISPN